MVAAGLLVLGASGSGDDSCWCLQRGKAADMAVQVVMISMYCNNIVLIIVYCIIEVHKAVCCTLCDMCCWQREEQRQRGCCVHAGRGVGGGG